MKQAILGFLVDQPMHGYQLKRALSPALPREQRVNDGILYPLLKRMDAEGLISGRVERRANGRERRVYHPTAAGRAIDMWAPIVPLPEVMRHVSEHFPAEMAGYLRVFYKREPRPEEFRNSASAMEMSDEAVIEALDAAGIGQTLITGFDEWSSV